MQTFKKILFVIYLIISFNGQIHAKSAYKKYYTKPEIKKHKVETKKKKHSWDKTAGKDLPKWDWK